MIRPAPLILSMIGLALAVLAPAAPGPGVPAPPRARVVPHTLPDHGHPRVDEYYWLRDRESPDVRAYLEAENAYTDAAMAHTRPLQEKLFAEITARIPKDEDTAPWPDGDYVYYERYERGGEYPVYCRRRASLPGPEEVILDGNALGRGETYFSLRGVEVSPGQQLVVYATDTVGRRLYTMRFKDLRTGRTLPDAVPNVTANSVWAADDRSIFYVKQHPETLRWYQVWRHDLGTDPKADRLVYEETDETYNIDLKPSKSRKYIIMNCTQTLASEVRLLRADQPDGEFVVFEPRRKDHEYRVEHAEDGFYIVTNWDAKNFRLMKAREGGTGRDHWTELVPHRPDVLLSGVEVFSRYVVLVERRGGLVRMEVRPKAGAPPREVDFGEPAYDAWLEKNRVYDTKALRYGYTSLTTPNSVYEYDLESGERTLVKRQEVLGGYDPGQYVTERLYARARDGVAVPVSIVHRKDAPRDGTSPLLLYAYGSYGSSTDAVFDISMPSLLDRGFVYAIAHVRGGQELGRHWYEDGKLLKKKNTFTDFVDCAQFLVEQRYTRPDRLFAQGGSAGGLLMGAITNMRPDLFRGVIAEVPFVDVVTTMLDDSIPLTTEEWDEWGDPRQDEYYDYMLSYSPYDQIEKKEYPSILVTTSLHDSQVQYWEPAKYVARLRARKTDDNVLLLKTDMEAGHSGKTGRFHYYEDVAFQFAFLLDLVGIDR